MLTSTQVRRGSPSCVSLTKVSQHSEKHARKTGKSVAARVLPPLAIPAIPAARSQSSEDNNTPAPRAKRSIATANGSDEPRKRGRVPEHVPSTPETDLPSSPVGERLRPATYVRPQDVQRRQDPVETELAAVPPTIVEPDPSAAVGERVASRVALRRIQAHQR